LSPEITSKYVSGRANSQEKKLVESHTVECDFCADAIEGLKLLEDGSSVKSIVDSLNNRIEVKITGREPKVVKLNYTRITSIAAVFAVLIIASFMLNKFLLNQSDKNSAISMKAEPEAPRKKTEALKDERKEVVEETLEEQSNAEPELDAIYRQEAEPISTKSTDSYKKKENKDFITGGAGTDDTYYNSGTKGYGADIPENTETKLLEKRVTLQRFADIEEDESSEVMQPAEEEFLGDIIDENRNDRDYKAESTKLAMEELSEQSVTRSKNKQTKRRSKAAMPASKSDILVANDKSSQAEVSQADAELNDLEQGKKEHSNKHYTKAITLFKQVLKDEPENKEAEWYLALSYIGAKETKEGKKVLNDIIEDKGKYQDQAQEQLDILD